MIIKEYRFYWLQTPAYIGQANQFQIGAILDDDSLIDVTNDCTFEILTPSTARIVDGNKIIVGGALGNVSVYIKCTCNLDSGNPYFYFSVALTQPLPSMNINRIYNTLINYMPKGVYDLSRPRITRIQPLIMNVELIMTYIGGANYPLNNVTLEVVYE